MCKIWNFKERFMAKNRCPVWVIVIGIAGIIMSCLGIYWGGVTLIMPKILQLQGKLLPEMMEQMVKIFPADKGHWGPSGPFPPGSIGGIYGAMLEKFMGNKPWAGAWFYISGAVLLAISGFYLFASFMFVLLKKSGYTLFNTALVLSCVYCMVNAAVFFSAGSLLGIAFTLGSIAAGVINAVLLLVVMFSGKAAFVYRHVKNK
jgi:hypothetical protein